MSDPLWIMHYVPAEDDQTPTGTNIHTHGLLDKFKHPDLQIVLPLSMSVAQSILNDIGLRIAKGEKFAAGQIVEDVLDNGYKITFIEALEGFRRVLRVILPDKHNNLDPATIESYFARQFQVLSEAAHHALMSKVERELL